MCEPVIQLSNISFTYPGDVIPVLEEVSLTVNKGDFIAIVGSNGSGKSTLCKLFNGLIPHYYAGEYTGDSKVCGLATETAAVAELSRYVGYVYQDFENQLVRPTVMDDVMFTPLNYGYKDYAARGERALRMMGLYGVKDSFIWSLSGGQKHLLALAGALAMDPEILVIDEPVSQLDPRHARQIYDILKHLNEDLGKTIIVIEHHAEFIADYCNEVVLMDRGRIKWKRPVREALSSVETLLELGIFPPQVTQAAWHVAYPQSPDSQRDHSSKEQLLPITLEEAIHWFAAEERTEVKTLEMPLIHQSETTDTANTMILAEDVHLSYRTILKKMQSVLDGVDLQIHSGESVAIVGNNGAGKSSLLKLIAGIVKPTSGYMQVNGQDVRVMTPEKMARHTAYVYQNPEEMFIEDSVEKEIAYYLNAHRVPDKDQRLADMLQHFRLDELRDKDARLLSGGQQRRTALAIGAAMEPAIMLLDEPTANLDIATKHEMQQVLASLKDKVETVIIATHDMQLVSEWATRIIVMHQGVVLADGTKEEIFADGRLLERAGLVSTQLMELSLALGLPRICYTLDEFLAFYSPASGPELTGEGEVSTWISSEKRLTASP
ncbi:ABC transporter ATP-binding protein [Paenibacillus sp. 453mf]|uniref:ABC transporter ATP-binding protein n=1 Tax=Paenibacillus sp. 453mf TaxID=1761874 RepID=UPI0008E4F2F8|nr:ABC transporter ATP-binding protein [Paenibacillus sp. 453mf]SFS54331.1 energy-coupling factor transport system ATP-binding protein [Paenibacillus sp. 453mf]